MVKKILFYLNLKKRGFCSFEGLLYKIKKDLIKLLLNLNITVSSKENTKEKSKVQKKEDFKKNRKK